MRSRIAVAAVLLLSACGNSERRVSQQVTFDTVAVLKTGAGPGELPIWPSAVVPMPRGGYLVIAWGPIGSGLVNFRLLYDSAGTFTDTLGHTGDGPGEYRAVTAAARSPDGRVFLADSRHRQLIVIGTDGEVEAATPLAMQAGRMEASSTALLMSGSRTDTAGRLQPLHAFDTGGHYLRSFGERDLPRTGLSSPVSERVAAADGHGGWWTARSRYRYELEHWDSAGRRTADLAPESDWFTPQAPPDPAKGEQEATRALFHEAPRGVSSISVDSAGHLWISGFRPSTNWETIAKGCEAQGPRAFECLSAGYALMTRRVLEVRAPESGALVASAEPSSMLQFMAGDLAYGTAQDADGFWRVVIYRLGLRPGGKP